MLPIKRPKRVVDEDEEQLLRLEAEFMKGKGKEKGEPCCVQVVTAKERPEADVRQLEEVTKRRLKKGQDEDQNQDPLSRRRLADNHDVPQVVTLDIMERNVSLVERVSPPSLGEGSFPKTMLTVKGLIARASGNAKGKRTSLFAQQFKCKGGNVKPEEEEEVESRVMGSGLESCRYASSGSSLGSGGKLELKRIHEENMEKLRLMSEKEIEESRREIMAQMDPKIIEMLTRKRKIDKTALPVESKAEELKENESEPPPLDTRKEKTEVKTTCDSLPLSAAKDNKWVHMDIVEGEKLKWMEPIIPKQGDDSVTQKTIQSKPRFSFDGSLMPLDEELPTERGLHHHGEEPERAGYTVHEMLLFIDSSLSSQKVIGLNALGKVGEKASRGTFDSCFNQSLMKHLLGDTPVALMVRKCLDDTSETVITAAVSCLRGLVCNTIVDELCLDRIFTWTQTSKEPLLAPSLDDPKSMEELKDDQLVSIDLIRGLLRSDILLRLRYLLEFNFRKKNDPIVVNNLLDILIRISRHSKVAADAVAKCPHLMELIVTDFLPPKITIDATSLYGNPFSKAIKLIRIIISNTSPSTVMSKYPQLYQSFQVYVTIDPSFFGDQVKGFHFSDALQVAIESTRVWCVLLRTGDLAASSALGDLFSILARQTQYLLSLSISHATLFDWQYAATLLQCLKELVTKEPQFSEGFNSLVRSVTFKWIAEMVNDSIVPNSEVLAAIGSGISYLTRGSENMKALSAKGLQPIFKSELLMKKIVDNLITYSSINCYESGRSGCLRDSPCLPSYGSVYFGSKDSGQVNVLLDENSVFPLVSSLVEALTLLDNDLASQFLKHLSRYLLSVTGSIRFSTFNSFESMELHLLSEICLLCRRTESSHDFLLLSMCLMSVTYEQVLKTQLEKSIIFDVFSFEPSFENKLEFMKISGDSSEGQVVEKSLKSPKLTREVYEKESHFESNLWIFDPIVNMSRRGDVNVESLVHCLRYVFLVNKRCPTLMEKMMISKESLFAITASCFLLGNNVFFEKEVADSLASYLTLFQGKEPMALSPSTVLPHFPSCVDLWDQLLNQFDSVSYGNKLFTHFILLFLGQNCDIVFKKKLYSEYSTCLGIMRVTVKEVHLVLDVKQFLEPLETDLQMVEFYAKELLSGTIRAEANPLLYLIAVHHLNSALFSPPFNAAIKGEENRLQMLIDSIHLSKNSQLRSDLLNYAGPDFASPSGLTLKTQSVH